MRRESGGRDAHLFHLTAAGRDLYRELFGEEPQESTSERLISRHKSAQHVYVNLQAADILDGWSDAVDLFPSRLNVPDLGVFDPDIIAVVDGKPIIVECERGNGGSRAQQDRKWEIMAAASGGELHVFVPNKATEQRVIKSVSRYAQTARAELNLRLYTVSVWI